MKYFLISIILLMPSKTILAQSLDYFNKIFLGENILTSVENVKTINDFNQNNLSIEEIDSHIAGLMIGGISNYEIPINQKKIKYYGRKNPKDVINFDVPSYERDMKMINIELEIYNYDGVWILVSDNSPKNLLNVFFTARALQIIKSKYYDAYAYLLSPDQVELGYKRLSSSENKPILNRLVPIISFDKSPSKIAGSLWNQLFAQEAKREYNGALWYENTLNALTSINYETDRPKEIYEQADLLSNYLLYLKEGLIESIVHEFTHHYITNFKFFDKKAGYAFNKRNDTSDKTFSFDAEEAMVINTTETYLIKKGGLSDAIISFNIGNKYQNKKIILNDVSAILNRTRFDDLKNLSPSTSTTFDQVYQFDFYKYPSVSFNKNR